METESQAKIAIRGKGSVKEGKGRSDAAHTSNQEEDLHCLIMADTEDKVNKAKQLIHNVIETVCQCLPMRNVATVTDMPQAASIPEGQNELKRNQLRELAALNGTLRDDENQACQNCGQIGHRKYDCPEQRNFTANIICRVCGNAGHMARDCPDRQRGQNWRNDAGPVGGRPGAAGRIEQPADAEFNSLMEELGGGGGAIAAGAPQARLEGAPSGDARAPKPWERGPTGAAAPWNQPRPEREGGSGAPPPWASGGGNSRSQDNSYGGGGGGGSSGYGQQQSGGYGGAAPWQQHNQSQQGYGGYGNYGGYSAPGYEQNSYGAPGAPGAGGAAPWQQQGYGSAPPPPPPTDAAPPVSMNMMSISTSLLTSM